MDGSLSWSLQNTTTVNQKLNGMLVQENIEKHITIVVGILNLETHSLRWSSAGHYPPPIIFEPNQPPKILTTSSFLRVN